MSWRESPSSTSRWDRATTRGRLCPARTATLASPVTGRPSGPVLRLNELVPGDFIYLTDTSGATWVYDVVRQWVVPPSDTAVLGATHRPELTLTTCNPRFEATTRSRRAG